MTARKRIKQHTSGVVLLRRNAQVVGRLVQRARFVQLNALGDMIVIGEGGRGRLGGLGGRCLRAKGARRVRG